MAKKAAVDNRQVDVLTTIGRRIKKRVTTAEEAKRRGSAGHVGEQQGCSRSCDGRGVSELTYEDNPIDLK